MPSPTSRPEHGDDFHDVPAACRTGIVIHRLQFSKKPVVTGLFNLKSFEIMKDMLVAVRGSEKAMREKPLAILTAVPHRPEMEPFDLSGSHRCLQSGDSAELISMPLTGATAPITLAGALCN